MRGAGLTPSAPTGPQRLPVPWTRRTTRSPRRLGLVQGTFEGNPLTFKPEWDSEAKELPDHTDVREIQARLKDQGVALAQEADPATSGPASISPIDPDGNVILIDQPV